MKNQKKTYKYTIDINKANLPNKMKNYFNASEF